MIDTIDKLQHELIARDIARENEISGCSESEILQIEDRYGKLPLSYRSIVSLVGHTAGFLSGDSYFYVSTDKTIDQIIMINKEFEKYKKETIKNHKVDDDLLKIPKNIFIIDSWDGNKSFILTSKKQHNKDSPVFAYKDIGTVEEEYSSVWNWINDIVVHTLTEGRDNVSDFWAIHYRKPWITESGELVIQKGYQK